MAHEGHGLNQNETVGGTAESKDHPEEKIIKNELAKYVLFFLAGTMTASSLKEESQIGDPDDGKHPALEQQDFGDKLYSSAREEAIKIVRETPKNIKNGYKLLFGLSPKSCTTSLYNY